LIILQAFLWAMPTLQFIKHFCGQCPPYNLLSIFVGNAHPTIY
jgi:hypothetical protein